MLVSFGGPAHATMPGQPLPAGPRLLMLKSAMMSGDDVRAVQQALNKHDSAGLDPDGIYDRSEAGTSGTPIPPHPSHHGAPWQEPVTARVSWVVAAGRARTRGRAGWGSPGGAAVPPGCG